MTRIECNFRHQLAEPRITQEPEGPKLSFTHGQDTVILGLTEASLSALWLTTTQALMGPQC